MIRMKKNIYLLLAVVALCLMSCSTKKNTWASRSFHQTKTKYNIYHNGAISYREGEEAIREANQDDYSSILNLYPVSNHEAAEASKSQMDRTIEKCRKCVAISADFPCAEAPIISTVFPPLFCILSTND